MQNSAPALIRLSIGVLAARDSERKVRHCCHCSQLSLLSLSLSVSQCNVASVVKPWTWRNTSRDELIWHVGHVVNIWTWESVSVSQSVNVRCELSWHLTPYLMCYGSQLPTLNSQLLAQTDYWDRLSQCSVHCSCCRVQLAQLADYWLFPRNDDEDSVFWFLGLRWRWWWFWHGQGAGQGGSQRKGLLLDKSPAELKVCGIDVSDPKYSSEDLFGTLSGSAFLDAVYGAFGVDERDIPWFFTGEGGKKERAIRRSPLSRPIQHSTAEAYKQRICKEGLSQLASGSWVCDWDSVLISHESWVMCHQCQCSNGCTDSVSTAVCRLPVPPLLELVSAEATPCSSTEMCLARRPSKPGRLITEPRPSIGHWKSPRSLTWCSRSCRRALSRSRWWSLTTWLPIITKVKFQSDQSLNSWHCFGFTTSWNGESQLPTAPPDAWFLPIARLIFWDR